MHTPQEQKNNDWGLGEEIREGTGGDILLEELEIGGGAAASEPNVAAHGTTINIHAHTLTHQDDNVGPRQRRKVNIRRAISHREAARRCGMGVQHLSRVIRGKRGCSLEVAAKIARAKGWTIDRLWNEIKKAQKEALAKGQIVRPLSRTTPRMSRKAATSHAA